MGGGGGGLNAWVKGDNVEFVVSCVRKQHGIKTCGTQTTDLIGRFRSEGGGKGG